MAESLPAADRLEQARNFIESALQMMASPRYVEDCLKRALLLMQVEAAAVLSAGHDEGEPRCIYVLGHTPDRRWDEVCGDIEEMHCRHTNHRPGSCGLNPHEFKPAVSKVARPTVEGGLLEAAEKADAAFWSTMGITALPARLLNAMDVLRAAIATTKAGEAAASSRSSHDGE